MGQCSTGARVPPPPKSQQPSTYRTPMTSVIVPQVTGKRPSSLKRSTRMQTAPPQPPPPPPLLDSDTHQIKSFSASQFMITPVVSGAKPSHSPTRRPIVVPTTAHLQMQTIGGNSTTHFQYDTKRTVSGGSSTKDVLVGGTALPPRATSIQYHDLVFKQTLGSGTYGEVSQGYWRGRKVAIKKIFPGETSKERIEVLGDFEREITILTRLKHPRVVQFLGAVNERNVPLCLVFELCEGSAALLLRMVRRGQAQVTWRICLGIMRDCAEAMEYLHSQKIMHRDLKAENLLLQSDFRCKLTDFGLSRVYDPRRPSKMTVCGTPCWVAPEIFREEAYDERVDVYSFGILIWEICQAKKPYADRDCVDLPMLVGHQGLRPEFLTHVPQDLNDLMSACWDENPNRRPDFGLIRECLDHVAAVVDANRRMGSPVHVSNQVPNVWVGSTHHDVIKGLPAKQVIDSRCSAGRFSSRGMNDSALAMV